MILGIATVLILISGVMIPNVHADRFSDWLDAYWAGQITDTEIKKRGQEHDAVNYQKEVLHFDYESIQNHDKGYKEPVYKEWVPAKTIQKVKVLNWLK